LYFKAHWGVPLANFGPEAFAEHAYGIHDLVEEEHLYQTPNPLGQIAVNVAGGKNILLGSNIVAMSTAQHVVGVVYDVPRLHSAGHSQEDLYHAVQSVGQQQK